jgi:hydrogenase maturation protein HypF
MALSYLHSAFGEAFLGFNLPFIQNLDLPKTKLLLQAIEKNINCPPTSSAGRLFDAVSAITNICLNHSFEAEGPMRLESIIDKTCDGHYPFEIREKDILFVPMICEIVNDVLKNTAAGMISAKFHNTIIRTVVDTCVIASKQTGLKKVALSGGVFQNSFILGKTETLLEKAGFTVLPNLRIPSNDGGIALGQLAIAAKKQST